MLDLVHPVGTGRRAAWCVLVAAAVAATSMRRFEAWDIYLAGAAVIVGLAIVIATVTLRRAEEKAPADGGDGRGEVGRPAQWPSRSQDEPEASGIEAG
jgi:hypothetical protein